MDVDLAENDVYQEVQKVQNTFDYYVPETEEEFLSYGQLACQEPNENTVFFIKDMMDEQHKNQADALRIFYDVQEAIRMNIPEEGDSGDALSARLLFFHPETGRGCEKRDPPLRLHDQMLGLQGAYGFRSDQKCHVRRPRQKNLPQRALPLRKRKEV